MMATDEPQPPLTASDAARLRARHSGLFGLCAIARHHGLDLELRALMHAHAVAVDEPPLAELARIARKHSFQTKTISLKYSQLVEYERVMPILCELSGGHFAILCGVRREDGAAAVVDPAWSLEHPGEHFRFVTAEEWSAEFTGKALLLKRKYALSDETQPFGLRWFLPYFLKLKGVFAQIALGVLLLVEIIIGAMSAMQVAGLNWVRVMSKLVVSPIILKVAVRAASPVLASKVTSMAPLPSPEGVKDLIHLSWQRTFQVLLEETAMETAVMFAFTVVFSGTESTSSVGGAESFQSVGSTYCSLMDVQAPKS